VPLPAPALRALTGIFAGTVFPIGGGLLIGRDSARVHVVYPPGAPGISAVHCSVAERGGVCCVTDNNSTHGTFLENGARLTPGQPCPLPRGGRFYLATKDNMFEAE
jgi:predicted component of type VI protein secretion system